MWIDHTGRLDRFRGLEALRRQCDPVEQVTDTQPTTHMAHSQQQPNLRAEASSIRIPPVFAHFNS